MSRYRAYLTPRRLAVLALLTVVGVAVLAVLRAAGVALTPGDVRTTLAELGAWGPVVLIAALAAVLVVPVIPALVFQMGAGLAFGPLPGLACVLVADVLGASIGFWLARRWGRALIEPRVSQETRDMLHRLAARISWRTLMLLRLLPGPAYPLVSFAAGYAPIRFWSYTLASFAGVLPSLALLVFAGDMVTRQPLLAFGLVAALVGALALVSRGTGWLARRG